MAFDAGLLVIRQRELFRKSWIWMREDGVTPFDVTGAQGRAECRSWLKGELQYAFDSNEPELGTVLFGTTDGRVEIRMEPEITASMTKAGPFDLFVVLNTGQRVKFATGTFAIEFASTQDD